MRNALVLAVMTFAAAAMCRAEPTSSPASELAATAKRNAAIVGATKTFRTAAIDADKRLQASLADARKFAMTKGDLDESNAIEATVKWLEAEISATDDAVPSIAPDVEKIKTARTAVNRYTLAVARARDTYRERVLTIEKQYIAALNAEKSAALKRGDLPKANQIEAMIKAEERASDPMPDTKTYLDDVDPKRYEGAGTMGRHNEWTTLANRHVVFNATIGGTRPQHWILTQPNSKSVSHAVYSLDGRYTLLTGSAAVDDTARDNPSGHKAAVPFHFEIVCDGRVAWKSKMMQMPGDFENFSVPVKGVQEIDLTVVCPGSRDYVLPVWVQPALHQPATSTTRPQQP